MIDPTKSVRNAAFALLLLGSVAGAASAATSVAAGIHIGPSGRASVDLGFFYDDLASYGNWIERPSYGWVWTPRSVATSWRPYQSGHWVWSDEGWVWVSDEPYGWATYHYGRWYDDPEIGWAWVPGEEWGPAWVSWQEGADYVGWAPLPPGASLSVSTGYGGYAYGLAPSAYCFVPERELLAPRVATYIVPTARVGGFWGHTRNVTHYRVSGGRVFNQGVPVERFERYGRRVPRYQVASLSGTDFRRHRGDARVHGSRLEVFRPQVRKARVTPPAQRAVARQAVVSASRFKAAHTQRVAVAQRERRPVRQARQETKTVLRHQTRVDQRQARGDQQRVKIDRARQLQAARQAQAARHEAQVRQERVRQEKARSTRAAQQRAKVDRARQVQASRQAQAAREREQARQRQRQVHVDRRQVKVDRRHVQRDRAHQRQAAHQPPRQSKGDHNGHRGSGKPPGH